MDFTPLRRSLGAREPLRLSIPDAREACVALILAPGLGGFDALFIKRALHPKDPWSGHVGLPGGRRDPEDADSVSTAVRETLEETAVELPRDSLLGGLDDIRPRPRLPKILIRPFVFGLDAKPETRLSPEVDKAFWIGLEELRACAGKEEVVHHGRTVRVPAFRAGPHVIWGITHRIMAPFLEAIAP